MKKQAGYTIIELMVVLAVVAIVLSVGLPRINVVIEGNAMVANSNNLLAGVHVARSQAIKRNQRVTICRADAKEMAEKNYKCLTDANGWDTGWFVFEEGRDVGNIIGEYTANDGEIIKVGMGIEGSRSTTITASNASIDKYVSFTSRGTPKKSSGNSQSGVFLICQKTAAGGVRAAGVVVTAAGHQRVSKDAGIIGVCP